MRLLLVSAPRAKLPAPRPRPPPIFAPSPPSSTVAADVKLVAKPQVSV